MKQKLKRFMAGFMAMLTLVGTLFTNGTTAFAASPQANIAFWNASVKNSGEVSELKPGYNHGKILYSILDGNSAYCMNFGLRADGGQLMNSYDDASTSMSAQQRKPFKCDVTGNDKNYGFNVVNENSTELVVFEAAIDLMSYVDIFTDYESNKLALGMLADAPLETFLREHPQITSIRFCLDGDEPGRKAAAELMRKYYELGYEVEDCPPPAGYKDYNEWLVAAKLNLNRMNKRADEPVRA